MPSSRSRAALVRSLPLALACVAARPLAGCSEPEPDPLHTITFLAHADPGDPLAGVEVATTVNGNRQVFGQTDEQGVLVQRLRAPYGTIIPIEARCPEGHRAPEMVTTIRFDPIRSIDPSVAARGIEHAIQCLPSERDVVVIVRATGTPEVVGVPVLVDGREVGTLDEGGVAHIPLRFAPNTSFRVELAAGSLSPFLEPRQPAHDFSIADADGYLTFDQGFTFTPPAPAVRRRPTVRRPTAPPPPSAPVRVPIRVGTGR